MTHEILTFAGEHWFLTILIVWAICGIIKAPFLILSRYFRVRNIRKHGWPTNPLMDADGDIVHPEKK